MARYQPPWAPGYSTVRASCLLGNSGLTSPMYLWQRKKQREEKEKRRIIHCSRGRKPFFAQHGLFFLLFDQRLCICSSPPKGVLCSPGMAHQTYEPLVLSDLSSKQPIPSMSFQYILVNSISTCLTWSFFKPVTVRITYLYALFSRLKCLVFPLHHARDHFFVCLPSES